MILVCLWLCMQVLTQRPSGSRMAKANRKEREVEQWKGRGGDGGGRRDVYYNEDLSQRPPRMRPQGRLGMEKGGRYVRERGRTGRTIHRMHFGQSNGTGLGESNTFCKY